MFTKHKIINTVLKIKIIKLAINVILLIQY